MKIILLLLASVGCGLCEQPLQLRYHAEIGIPAADSIRAAETLPASPAPPASRVAGGRPAALGDFPYLAGLLVELTMGATSVCGASLLSHTRLLTAAHCWFDGRYQGSSVTAVLGSTRLFSGGTRLVSSQVEMHEGYNPNNLNNDIAIITIPSVSYSETIKPVTLPSSFLLWLTYENNIARLAGFGITSTGEGISVEQSLRQTSALVVNNLDCQTVYGFNVIQSTLCTSGEGRVGPCGGDSGGPLAVHVNGEDVLIGVVSFHAGGGCEIGFPGGYARVTSFVPWILARL